MIRELYTEDLDINLKYNVYLQCVQNDDIILNINVYDKSIQADLNNYTCRLKALKSDQIPLIQNTNININKNVVTIEANKQLTTTTGIVKAELQFTDKSTLKKKSTFFIEIKVEKSSLNVDGAVSTPLCTLLEEIDNKLDQIENIGLVLDEAKQVRDTLESDIVVANTTNENIVQSISDADSKKREVETSITNASNKIEEVEESIINANSSKTELDNSKELADTTKTNLDSANVQAEKNIEALKELGDVTDLAKNVQTNTNNISLLQERVSSNTSQLNENTQDITNLKTDIPINYIKRTIAKESLDTLNQDFTDEGRYHVGGAKAGLPDGYPTENDLVLESIPWVRGGVIFRREMLYDIRNAYNIFTRQVWDGTYNRWYRLLVDQDLVATKINLPYVSGYIDCDANWTSKLLKVGNIVICYINAKKSNGTYFESGVEVQLATLPSGYTGASIIASIYNGRASLVYGNQIYVKPSTRIESIQGTFIYYVE